MSQYMSFCNVTCLHSIYLLLCMYNIAISLILLCETMFTFDIIIGKWKVKKDSEILKINGTVTYVIKSCN